MKLACCIWGLDYGRGRLLRLIRKHLNKVVPETTMLAHTAELGFKFADIQPNMQQSEQSVSLASRLNLNLTCMSLSHHSPAEGTLHSTDQAAVHLQMSYFKKGIDLAADRNIERAYIVPGRPDDTLKSSDYADHYANLAEYGQAKGIRIGIEHFPKTALPTIESTLNFIKEVSHPNLYLLFDIGHAQISNEDPIEWLPEAGDRLLYVHLDDNDGKEDLHLPLTEGVQTREDLERLFEVLTDMSYDGPVSLELHPHLSNPYKSLAENKALLESIYSFE